VDDPLPFCFLGISASTLSENHQQLDRHERQAIAVAKRRLRKMFCSSFNQMNVVRSSIRTLRFPITESELLINAPRVSWFDERLVRRSTPLN